MTSAALVETLAKPSEAAPRRLPVVERSATVEPADEMRVIVRSPTAVRVRSPRLIRVVPASMVKAPVATHVS